VDAFVSHSWSDAGGAKFDKLHAWAAASEGEEKTVLWLDKVPSLRHADPSALARVAFFALMLPPSRAVPHPLRDMCRQACIDQLNIEASLACLPVFLSGCKQLLILAGETYSSRLWCVMEIFVFVRMGGTRDAMVVKLLDATGSLATCLTEFDAGKAKCFLDGDRQRLWAVIEASFGTFDPFNKIVRGIFVEQIEGVTIRA
jgi:hypothetical protein